MSLFHDLKDAIGSDWTDYTEHSFVAQLDNGTLPLSAFQDYLVQDYLFLVQFARAYALTGYKARTIADIAAASSGLATIVHETELHRRMTERWGITGDELEAAPEKIATVAYTRYVLDCGLRGDLLDLHVALAPCMIGYAEIGEALEPALGSMIEHPYEEWISEYASPQYQTAAQECIQRLDRLAGDSITARRFEELVAVFRSATRMESAFWQQALILEPSASR